MDFPFKSLVLPMLYYYTLFRYFVMLFVWFP